MHIYYLPRGNYKYQGCRWVPCELCPWKSTPPKSGTAFLPSKKKNNNVEKTFPFSYQFLQEGLHLSGKRAGKGCVCAPQGYIGDESLPQKEQDFLPNRTQLALKAPPGDRLNRHTHWWPRHLRRPATCAKLRAYCDMTLSVNSLKIYNSPVDCRFFLFRARNNL